ncbi:phosphate/phosphite/phosphonate ABC transporter substrate-binding protein [Pelagovum pacificum]|uniref:Phosphate/phosphite/phosphonate ABC transporter substrate-binding protein n=1 Tax=Pelagovum pacificum TaxID=2588711 RepID=A0A5C5GD98_9RHOB|nr:PhnD/SsuA/transferrin family substrate-binding protein [Pelagovum pacificum]QQA44086.1 PhnD/SsuA/transferrin family substrate-binding protein [Pelagovum pacificum]TNY32785.1 phosphate/phosphite/phosphonate ABC transporter substrate-binding protein [Pelagovum pacificum]
MSDQPRAAMPMYERPETREAQDRLWQDVRANLSYDTPATLESVSSLWDHWLSEDLIFTQACSLPYRARLHGTARIVGTADYGLPGCPPGHYNSVFVMRPGEESDDPAHWATLRLAYNSRNSQSGWAAPQNHMIGLGLSFDRTVSTGAHLASITAVANGTADIACIDARTWAQARAWDAEASDLHEVGRTEPTPGLPFITGPNTDAEELSTAIETAIGQMSDADRTRLGIVGFAAIPTEAYLAVPTPPAP